jgi:hypothetical protein
MKIVVTHMRKHVDRSVGKRVFCTFAIKKSTTEAMTKRIPADRKGGKFSSPIFIPSQVEPQMRHRSATREKFSKSLLLQNISLSI